MKFLRSLWREVNAPLLGFVADCRNNISCEEGVGNATLGGIGLACCFLTLVLWVLLPFWFVPWIIGYIIKRSVIGKSSQMKGGKK